MLHARDDYNRIQDPGGKIPVDEPVFLIRAQDNTGATIVRIWALLQELQDGDSQLADMARDHADRMDEWPVHKKPDL